MTHIHFRTGSSPNALPHQHQAEPAPADEPPSSPKKADEQALPRHEVRSGEANRRRFMATHGKAGDAGTSDNAPLSTKKAVDKADAAGVEGGVRRRREPTAEASNAASQAGTAPAAPRQHRRREPLLITKLYLGTMKALVTALALSTAYRAIRNPGDFASHPGAAIVGALTFSERVDGQILQDGQQAVLARFGSYIPANSPCHQVRAEVSFDMTAAGIPAGTDAAFNGDENRLMLAPYHARKGALHAAVHEYCHCFTHPRLKQALENHPNHLVMDESLTEHLTDKIPSYGALSKFMSTRDTPYHRDELSNGKNMQQAAQELEDAVGEATLMRAYFSGDKTAIRKIARAAVDIYPKTVSSSTWDAVRSIGGKEGIRELAECFVAASLLSEGKLPPDSVAEGLQRSAGMHLPVAYFSYIDREQQAALIKQGEQARERLGAKFDQAFYSFDEDVAKQAMRAVRKDLLANWEPVMAGKSFYGV